MASGLQPLAATNLTDRLMELVYGFDPARFHLGTLCKRGHRWPGTEQSLRRTYIDKNGKDCSQCAGCTGSKRIDWLYSFLDRNAVGLNAGEQIGPVCKSGHLWQGRQVTLRFKGKCRECEKIRKRKRSRQDLARQYQKMWYRKNRERILEGMQDPEARARLTRNTQNYRRRRTSRPCRSKHEELKSLKLPRGYTLTKLRAEIAVQLFRDGHPLDSETLLPLVETQYLLITAIRNAGKAPTVSQLVQDEQRRYWSDHPEEFAIHKRQQNLANYRWRYKVDPEFRLYVRQKSKRRKAQMRNSTAHQLTGRQIRRRFAEFDHRCAYCGSEGNMHIEHVNPISKGGIHALSNIVPACQSCNYRKHTSEVEQWYRAQPFFTDQRWQAICNVTDAGLLPVAVQLGLPLAG